MHRFTPGLRLPSVVIIVWLISTFTLVAAPNAGDSTVTATSEKRFQPSKAQPFAPSNASVEGGRKLVPEDFEDPAVCAGCHPVQYQGWKGSMHSNSFNDPIFQAEWALAEKELGPEISKFCGGCHAPAGMLTDTIKFDPEAGEHGAFTAPDIARNGVFCDVCHTISGNNLLATSVLEHGNGSYVSSPGRIKRGPLKDAQSPYHETEYSEHHTKSDFCGNCHNIFNPLNNFPIERTYDEWKYSVYAQQGVQCQDCHMVPVETAMRVADEMKPVARLENHQLGGFAGMGADKERDVVHGHGFVGGNAVVTAMLNDDAADGGHAAIARERLENVAELELFLKRVSGPLHELKVKVTNRRAGHDLPTSLTHIRELWLDVTILDDKGNTLLRSGALDAHQEIDPDAVMFKSYAVDKAGKPAEFIWHIERFENRTTIPPKGHRYGQYAFNVPDTSPTVTVIAKLNYRSFSQHFADHLLGKGKLKVPTIEMERMERRFETGKLRVTQRE
ncbi:MAG: multiheme c-type cytochrome [Thiotrichales bacterium]